MNGNVMFALTVASFAVSAASLLFTMAAHKKLDDDASEAFAVIGADEGNHEARLERLEVDAGLSVIPSPSALENIQNTEGCFEPGFEEEFAVGHLDAMTRAEDMDAERDPTTHDVIAHLESHDGSY